ncbi:MAG TPA: DNA polymerase/3'-5' exonuclease PolX [Phycisphaeraceae bacterium]
MPANNAQLVLIFQAMADITELLGGNPFRVTAFQRAARVLGELTRDVAEIPPEELTQIEGIGEGTAQRIAQFLKTGHIKEYDELIKRVPQGVVKLLEIPGLGPKTVATLWHQGGVTDVATLMQKLQTGELESLPRLGKKKLENIRKSLEFTQTASQRIRLGEALPLARWFVDRLRRIKGVKEADYAGSVRRGRETIGDLDLLAAASPQDAPAISAAFTQLDGVAEVLAQGPTKTSIRTDQGVQVDLRIVEPSSYGAALLYFTGSKEHNIRLRERAIDRGYKLSEYGLFSHKTDKLVAGRTEEEVYRALDLPWIPPELREDRGEIALAQKGKLPRLIELGDIQAELHAHTTASDGVWTIRELVAAAVDRGFHTVAVTDHSKSQTQARGLTADRLKQHIQDVREAAREFKGKIHVLVGSEVDILADGKLDYPDSLLKELDIVVASPHSALSQEPAKATKRLIRAIENRYVTILGHPTGRIVGRREGLLPDMDQVINAAAQRGIALEINANYHRLDLRDTHARAAIKAGVKLAINTDAHGPADLDQLTYGVLTARRAGAAKKNVINCLSQAELMKWIASTRP